MKVWYNRFIEGRPNPITLPLTLKGMLENMDYQIGCRINRWHRDINLWTYTSNYPPQIEVDCSLLTVKNSIKIGDIEALLPDGVFLHKKYLDKTDAVVTLIPNHNYKMSKYLKKSNEEEFETFKQSLKTKKDTGKEKRSW